MRKPKPEELPSCGVCRCWVAEPGAQLGACKRLPPVVIVLADAPASVFPSTARHDICGEFARRLQS
jgi:hypothetical protein